MVVRLLLYGIVGMLALIAVGTVLFPRVAELGSGPREVRWLVAHQPADVYAQAIQVFRSELEKESHGTMTLRVVTPQDLGYAGVIPHDKILMHLRNGDVDISSVYATDLGTIDQSFFALNLPLLFDDYAQVNAAFDGSVGEGVLDSLAGKSDLRGLAFTLSGGFLVLVSPQGEERHLSDFAGKRIATAGGAVAAASIEALGGIPVPMEDVNDVSDARSIDAIETSYARIAPILERLPGASVYESNHRLLFTAIVATDGFIDSLSSAEARALTEVAREAGRIEREDSIARAQDARTALVEKNAVSVPTDAERVLMERSFSAVYARFASGFEELISSIRALR